ncbi:MAG: type ISP restriction/modification enzyme [Alphaproteobacteria bacterium]
MENAQKKYGLPEIALMICDEAHRTAVEEILNKKLNEKNYFIKPHNNQYVKARKRLYMTATPKIYGEKHKIKTQEEGRKFYNMDNEQDYGPEFYKLSFADSVKKDLLVDYKILVLHVPELYSQELLSDVKADDRAKIIGCWNGLRKHSFDEDEFLDDKQPMKRAIAFANKIKDSQDIRDYFNQLNDEQNKTTALSGEKLQLSAEHIDGSMGSQERERKIKRLKDSKNNDNCHILSNARCLAEGVDVPDLDAVMFLQPRKAVIDVVQAVGRVMRKPQGNDEKKYGYVILPIVTTNDDNPKNILDNNERYKIVWQTLQALKSHDESLANLLSTNDLKALKQKMIVGKANDKGETETTEQLKQGYLPLSDLQDKIYAKAIEKTNEREYLSIRWSKEVKNVVRLYGKKLDELLEKNQTIKESFDALQKDFKKNISPNINDTTLKEMLSQHFITEPIFDAFFTNDKFGESNPMAKSLNQFINLPEIRKFDIEKKPLEKFYYHIERRINVEREQGRFHKKSLLEELYEDFFKEAFPEYQEQAGVVYTPIEIVDYILHSVNSALQAEFGKTLSDDKVHILDPFTGTGTFITRLLQNPNLISDEKLQHKYDLKLHANDIALLPYYIASINIEKAFYDRYKKYQHFNNIVLTDTFNLGEQQQEQFAIFAKENSARAEKQKKLRIKVIIGNPPYSAKQKSAMDNNPNPKYPYLDERIKNTYVKKSLTKRNKNTLYDSYIRSLRWASDRIDNDGIICFVSSGSYLTTPAMDGVRISLQKEFSKIYIFDARGNARKQGEEGRKEGGNVFGDKSMAPITITLLIKKQNHQGDGEVFYHDIGDNLKTNQKLDRIKEKISYQNIKWQKIIPDKHGDYINQRSGDFDRFLPMGDKKEEYNNQPIFYIYSLGIASGKDPWVYNFSQEKLQNNMKSMINFYNEELTRNKDKLKHFKDGNFLADATKIRWSSTLKNNFRRGKKGDFDKNHIILANYRPFVKKYLYYDKQFINSIYLMPKIFPTPESKNIIIVIQVIGKSDFSALVSNRITDLQFNSNAQCFPRYSYNKAKDLLDKNGTEYSKTDNITDTALHSFQTHYKNESISKDDIFYYIYGVLSHPTYKEKYQNYLTKMLPHIPFVDGFAEFISAGRQLAELHLNYETLPIHNDCFWSHRKDYLKDKKQLPFEKIQWRKNKTNILYNDVFTMHNIPKVVHQYKIKSKTPIDWVIAQYQKYTDDESNIAQDPNDFCNEMGDPAYIYNLIGRLITLSVKSIEIINNMPKFVVHEKQN